MSRLRFYSCPAQSNSVRPTRLPCLGGVCLRAPGAPGGSRLREAPQLRNARDARSSPARRAHPGVGSRGSEVAGAGLGKGSRAGTPREPARPHRLEGLEMAEDRRDPGGGPRVAQRLPGEGPSRTSHSGGFPPLRPYSRSRGPGAPGAAPGPSRQRPAPSRRIARCLPGARKSRAGSGGRTGRPGPRGAQPTPPPRPLPCPGGGLRLTSGVAGDSRTWFLWMVPRLEGAEDDARGSARPRRVTPATPGPPDPRTARDGAARQIPTREPPGSPSRAKAKLSPTSGASCGGPQAPPQDQREPGPCPLPHAHLPLD